MADAIHRLLGGHHIHVRSLIAPNPLREWNRFTFTVKACQLFYFSIFKGRQVIFLHLLICLFNISFTEVGKSFFQLHILLSLFNIFYSLQFLCKSFLQLLLRFEYLRHCPFSNPWFLCYCLFLLFFLCFLSSLLFCLNYFTR